jgi:feruloyl esterase
MIDFRKVLGDFDKNWQKFQSTRNGAARSSALDTPLEEVQGAGPNPGNLRMFSYMPPRLADNPALVVVLHGCTQTAASYNFGAGWSTLADRYGFALLMPEQQRSNNLNGCFNWFQPEDTRRDQGEAASIRQMIEKMVSEKDIDPRRVFITGLSAGGAMTSAMLACYPELFAGGAIIAGLPYGTADNVQQAFVSMFQCPTRSAQEWGDLVRAAVPLHDGPWPRISVWHGNVDKTVIPPNAGEILKQWTNVHGLQVTPSSQVTVDGYPRQTWFNQAGEELIESYTIIQMAHGTPLASGEADFECGVAGPFLLEVGISSSFHIAKFFGLTAAGVRSSSIKKYAGKAVARLPVGVSPDVEQSQIHHGELLEHEAANEVRPRLTRQRIDIGAVINKALEAAGLMKRK